MPATAPDTRPGPGRGSGLPLAVQVLAVVLAALVVAAAVGLLALTGPGATGGTVTPERAAAARTATLLVLLGGGAPTLLAGALVARRAGRTGTAAGVPRPQRPAVAALPAEDPPGSRSALPTGTVVALAGQARLLALNAAIAAARAGGADEVLAAVAEQAHELARQAARVAGRPGDDGDPEPGTSPAPRLLAPVGPLHA